MTFFCPICDSQLIMSNHTDMIYNCQNKPFLNNPNHYSCHIRRINNVLEISQEDFQYDNYVILKIVDPYSQNPYRYYICEEWEDPGTRWHFSLEPKDFDNLFPNFNPKDIETIIKKFETLSIFS